MNECVFCFQLETIHCPYCGQYLCMKHYFRNHGLGSDCMIDEGRYTEFPSYNEILPIFGTKENPFVVYSKQSQFTNEEEIKNEI